MVEFTISKSKVGPVTEWYVNGQYEEVEPENSDGVSRVAVLGLDNSHSKDYKVSYASDALITVQSGEGTTHAELKEVLKELGVWSVAQFHPIEIAHSGEWRAGFKTTPDRVQMIDLMFEKVSERLDSHKVLGDAEQFSVYY
jgi:hypothetical protein